MATLSDIAKKYTNLDPAEIEWLEVLVLDWSLLADLALSDVVLWVKTRDDEFLAVAHARPSGLITMFYRDVVGDYLRNDWKDVVSQALDTGLPAVSTSLTWYEEAPMHLAAYPVCMRDSQTAKKSAPFAVVTVHNAPNDVFSANRTGSAYRESADDLLAMIQSGYFPSVVKERGRRRGAPRASDGLMRVDETGTVTFASPNTLTSFNRLGYRAELEDENLADVVASITAGEYDTNELLPQICAAKAPRRADIEARGHIVTLRAIPVYIDGKRVGGIVLSRDITDIKQQAQELITKNATIREIHHRVKNNLQTVASLLRVQTRRAKSDEAKLVLGQAMRRVAAIAVVHDALATGVDQIVNFDAVCDRVLGLAAEVASLHSTVVSLQREGKFGMLPSQYATPLALALTEIVTNAVEHGLSGREGTVTIITERSEEQICTTVLDDGIGFSEGKAGDGLGTQIVRTLIEGELGGEIKWLDNPTGGAKVVVHVPVTWTESET